MDLAQLLETSTAELLERLHELIRTVDEGVVDGVFNRRGIEFDSRWQVRVLTLGHEDIAILIHDVAKSADNAAWFNSLETVPNRRPERRDPIPGVNWRWFFEVHSTSGRVMSVVRVSAETESEAIAVARQRIDADRILGRAIPYRRVAAT